MAILSRRQPLVTEPPEAFPANRISKARAVTAVDITVAMATHEAAGNPHPIYLTQAEGDALYAPVAGANDYWRGMLLMGA